eukprot:8797355-Heterocapsa_arctica.AAC.1
MHRPGGMARSSSSTARRDRHHRGSRVGRGLRQIGHSRGRLSVPVSGGDIGGSHRSSGLAATLERLRPADFDPERL